MYLEGQYLLGDLGSYFRPLMNYAILSDVRLTSALKDWYILVFFFQIAVIHVSVMLVVRVSLP
jgi:hypothetical protein